MGLWKAWIRRRGGDVQEDLFFADRNAEAIWS